MLSKIFLSQNYCKKTTLISEKKNQKTKQNGQKLHLLSVYKIKFSCFLTRASQFLFLLCALFIHCTVEIFYCINVWLKGGRKGWEKNPTNNPVYLRLSVCTYSARKIPTAYYMPGAVAAWKRSSAFYSTCHSVGTRNLQYVHRLHKHQLLGQV